MAGLLVSGLPRFDRPDGQCVHISIVEARLEGALHVHMRYLCTEIYPTSFSR